MNFKSLQSFFVTHRQLFFVFAGVLFIFIVYTSPVFAQQPSAEEIAAAAKANADAIAQASYVAPTEDWGIFGSLIKALANLIFIIAVGLGGMVTSIGGLLLDVSVTHTILKVGEYLNATNVDSFGGGIVQLWQVIRDMFNILFIFSLVYLGIKTVLQSDNSETQRKIGFIIIAALMINFSLYITQAIVDFTNIIAVQIFNQIMSGNATIATYQDNLVKIGSDSISGAFMNVAGITSFFGASAFLDQIPSPLKVIVFGIMFMVFLIVAGIVFAMGAFMLIARFVTLIVYMVLSPIMFAGWIFPNFAQYQEKWWGGFLKQAFFAPAFLFMLYLSMVVLQRALKFIVKTGGNPDYSAVMKGGQMGSNEFTIFFFFAMMIGFLYASIKVGEMMGIAGAKGAMKITQKTIGGATAGLAARAGRGIIGGAGHALSESKMMKDFASKSALGKGIMEGTRFIADSNFDVRSTGIAGKYLGEAKKGGYKTRTGEVQKKAEEFSKSLGEIGDDDKAVSDLKHHEHELHNQLEVDQEIRKAAIKAYNDASPEGKVAAKKIMDDAADKVEATKKAIKKAQQDITTEKNRRIVGSAAINTKIAEDTKTLEKAQKEKKELTDQLAEAYKLGDKTLVKSLEEKIKDHNKNTRTLSKSVRKLKRQAGYAGRLETSTWVPSWVGGHQRQHDNAAGVAVRKKFSKESIKNEAHAAKNDEHKDDKEHDGEHDEGDKHPVKH